MKVILKWNLDVVPASKEQFTPKIKVEKGKRIMYGRGTSDMKGPVVSILLAFIESIREGCNKDIALLFTTDEELGGFKGMKYLVDQNLRANIFFIPMVGNN